MSNMQRARKTWTRDEFWKMHDAGVFGMNRYELIVGEIIPVSPQSNLHALGISNTEDALLLVFDPARFWVRAQFTLDLSPHSVPDPDIAVVAGSKASYRGRRTNPTTALLIVEVSDSTLADDREWKGSLYAASGIPEYWILNIPDNVLEVRRDPRPDATQPLGFGYATLVTFTASDFVTPLAVPGARIPVADLLPG
jgi:Uma2 family endonuclease